MDAPPSKSYTHRAILAGVIAQGRTIIHNPLKSTDTYATASLAEALGAKVEWGIDVARIQSQGPQWIQPGVDCIESGTTLRLGIGVASLLDKPFILYGRGRLNKRPIKPLLTSLRMLGASYLDTNGHPPVAIKGRIHPGKTEIDAGDSSQFLSAILLAGAGIEGGVEVNVARLSSKGYVDVTVGVIEAFGGRVHRRGYEWFRVEGPIMATTFYVPGDWSSAASILAIAVSSGGSARINGVRYPDPQPDSRIIDILRGAGARVHIGGGWVEASSTGKLEPIEVDLDESPDLAPIASAMAAVSCGISKICGVSRLRLKESDRIETIISLLKSAGVDARLEGSCIVINGACGLEGGRVLDSMGDHRIAMAAALLAIASRKGFWVRGWKAVDKSYPAFWRDLERLGVRLDVSRKSNHTS